MAPLLLTNLKIEKSLCVGRYLINYISCFCPTSSSLCSKKPSLKQATYLNLQKVITTPQPCLSCNKSRLPTRANTSSPLDCKSILFISSQSSRQPLSYPYPAIDISPNFPDYERHRHYSRGTTAHTLTIAFSTLQVHQQ